MGAPSFKLHLPLDFQRTFHQGISLPLTFFLALLPLSCLFFFFFFFFWGGGGGGGSWGTRDSSINNVFTMNFLMGEVPLFLFVFKFFDFVFCGVSQSRHYILFDIYISELWQDFNGFCPSSG